jgi:hypothetical protein
MKNDVLTFHTGDILGSPDDLRQSLARSLDGPRVEVSQGGRQFELLDHGVVVLVDVDGDGNAVSATASISLATDVLYIMGLYNAFRSFGWHASGDSRV